MIDFSWMDQELDQFHDDHEGRRNLKMLIDFQQSKISYTGPVFNPGTPKMKKKLTAHKWIKQGKDKGSLF
jgi:hypothetical protein